MKPFARRKARSLAVQALYQWQVTALNETIISHQFLERLNPKKVDVEYFYKLLQGVINNCEIIDKTIAPFLDRKTSELDTVEFTVLRLATYELLYCLEIPYKVVINEALELTKNFGSIAGYKYINGVLDRLAKARLKLNNNSNQS
jgi:N utilization substance protein B